MRRFAVRHVIGAAGALLLAIALAVTLTKLTASPDQSHGQKSDGSAVLATPGQPKTIGVAPGWTLIASAKTTTREYTAPGARSSDAALPTTWNGAPAELPVLAQQPGWLEVGLQSRPNGSTAWVHSTDMSVTTNPYRIDISLADKHLRLYRQDKLVLDAPAGVGTSDDPTPKGNFFVAFFEQAPSPDYGPFIMVTTAHSNSITDWESSGDAVIGIHGPLGEDSQIGTQGAAISHGCIRLHDSDLQQLRQVPAGTPIVIS